MKRVKVNRRIDNPTHAITTTKDLWITTKLVLKLLFQIGTDIIHSTSHGKYEILLSQINEPNYPDSFVMGGMKQSCSTFNEWQIKRLAAALETHRPHLFTYSALMQLPGEAKEVNIWMLQYQVNQLNSPQTIADKRKIIEQARETITIWQDNTEGYARAVYSSSGKDGPHCSPRLAQAALDIALQRFLDAERDVSLYDSGVRCRIINQDIQYYNQITHEIISKNDPRLA